MTCPIDGEKFTIMVTMSYTTFSTLRDFQQQGAIGDLYESMINSCPKCHYSGYEDDLDTVFTESIREDILKILVPYRKLKMDDVIECEIAARIHLYFKDKNSIIGNIYLVGSYLAKTSKKKAEKRKELQSLSISYLVKALDGKEYEEEDKYASMNYLVGELYRRTGDFDNAIKYFDTAIKDENKKEWVEKVAEEQKQLAINKDDNNKI
jgi:hypothetical protein